MKLNLGRAPLEAADAGEGRRHGRESNVTAVIVRAVVDALECDPELTRRVRVLLGGAVAEASRAPECMLVAEYAKHARVSEKTIRAYLRAGMIEGEHFHREGRTGRRVIIHVREADLWRTARRPRAMGDGTLVDIATDDILRRRAQVALKKARSPR